MSRKSTGFGWAFGRLVVAICGRLFNLPKSFAFQLRAINVHDLCLCDTSWGFSVRWQQFSHRAICIAQLFTNLQRGALERIIVTEIFIRILVALNESEATQVPPNDEERIAELMQMAFKFLYGKL